MRLVLGTIATLLAVTIAYAVPAAVEATGTHWGQEYAAPGVILAGLIAWPLGTLIFSSRRTRR